MTESVELITRRLLLRPFKLGDAVDVFAYASDPEWARYLPVPQPYELQHAEQFVAQRVLTSWDTNPVWAVVLSSKVVGGIGLRINTQHETGELGYSLARELWGQGLVPEACRAVVHWGFKERGLAKVFARADGRNRNSQRVMEKLGMTREGLLRSHIKGRYGRMAERIDDVYFGLLRDEWNAGLEKHLE